MSIGRSMASKRGIFINQKTHRMKKSSSYCSHTDDSQGQGKKPDTEEPRLCGSSPTKVQNRRNGFRAREARRAVVSREEDRVLKRHGGAS